MKIVGLLSMLTDRLNRFSPSAVIISQTCLLFALPNLAWLLAKAFGGESLFPLRQTETIFLVFPKLRREYDVLSEVYSETVASQYVLSYANAFVAGAAVLFIGSFLSILLICSRDGEARARAPNLQLSEVHAPIRSTKSFFAELRLPILIIIGLAIFFFFIPITYHPTQGVSIGKQLVAIYAAFSVAFPLLFFFAYLLFLAVIRHIRLRS